MSDDKLGDITDCSATSLDPGDFMTCTATYQTVTADAGQLANTGSVTGTPTAGELGDPAATDQLTVTINAAPAAPAPALSIKKTAGEDYFSAAGDLIHYTYVIKNTGNVTLDGPFTVSDNKIQDPNSVACPATDSLDPGDSITCTATYTVTTDDVNAGSVTNQATAAAANGGDPVTSTEDTVTVPIEAVGGRTFTPPPTSTPAGQGSGDGGTPLFALLICFAFGSLALLTIQAQRRSVRR